MAHFQAAVNVTQREHRSLVPRLLLGLTARDEGDYATAEEILSTTTTFLDDQSPEIHHVLGRLYYAYDDYSTAALALLTALQLAPEDASIWLDMCRARYANGQPDEGLAAAREVLALSGASTAGELEALAGELERSGRAAEAGELRAAISAAVR